MLLTTVAGVHPPAGYDVFLSYARQDRVPVAALVTALRERGLRVFVDDDAIREGDGITPGISRALAESTVLVAYYSLAYPTRFACQWELTTAFLAADDPTARILALNPERSAEHLEPAEVRDARFADVRGASPDWGAVAERVTARVRSLSGLARPGPVRATTNPVPSQVHRPRRFVGRFPHLWRLHSALTAQDFRGTRRAEPSPAAVVTGMAGIGKSSLAAQYAYLFGAAYPGGVFWVDPLSGRTEDDVLAGYADRLRGIAGLLGLPGTGADLGGLQQQIAGRLSTGSRVLWVVDAVPDHLTSRGLDQLLIPSPLVRTVLTSRKRPEWDAATVELSGLSREEGRLVFAEARESTDTADPDIDRLLDRIGGHPLLVRAIGRSLRNREGFATVADRLADLGRIADHAQLTAEVLALLPGGPQAPVRQVLELASLLAQAPVPPALIAAVLARPDSGSPGAAAIGAAVHELAELGLASRTGDGWLFHPLALDAVRTLSRDPGTTARAAATAATAVLAMLTGPPGSESAPLRDHGRVLAAGADLSRDRQTSLLRAVLAGYATQGDMINQAAVLEEILDRGEAVEDRLAAARAMLAIGRWERAHEHARRAVDLATPHSRTAYRAGVLLMHSLDRLGAYADADAVDPGPAPAWLSPDERLELLVIRAVGVRLRGHPRRALTMIRRELATRDVDPRVLLAARTELARLELESMETRAARVTAAEVVDGYEALGLGAHPRCMEARAIGADAELTPELRELSHDPRRWVRSEQELRRIHDEYRDTLGRDNPLTLTAAYRRDLAVLRQGGRAADAEELLRETEGRVVRALGAGHPLHLQVRYATGLAHLQRKQCRSARDILADAHERQVATLGGTHVQVLETALALAAASWLCGDEARAVALAQHARRHLPDAVGRRNDLVGQAWFGSVLFLIPSPVGRALLDLGSRLGRLWRS